MGNLKAIAIDKHIPLYVRTALSPETQRRMGTFAMKVPGKVLFDGRMKPLPVSHQKTGRPRKDRVHERQLRLIEGKVKP